MPYFASHSVGAELPKAQGGLNAPEQCHHVQVLDPSPKEESTVRVASLLQGDLCRMQCWKSHLDLPRPATPCHLDIAERVFQTSYAWCIPQDLRYTHITH